MFPSADRSSLEETEWSLRALMKLAANPECVSGLVERLAGYMKLVLALIEPTEAPAVEHAINQLFMTIIQVGAREEHDHHTGRCT